jgi:integrase
LAFRVLQKWKEKSRSDSQYIFPSLRKPGFPIGSVKTTWRSTLRRVGVPHFPIYNLRHAFCTRLSWVAPDAVIERAMRHTSPETKRVYQLSMVEQVREANGESESESVWRSRHGSTDAVYMTGMTLGTLQLKRQNASFVSN